MRAEDASGRVVLQPSTQAHLDGVRDLMRAFIVWHRQRHPDELALIDQYFDKLAFESELAGLPGKYAPPKGHLLLALQEDQPAGCVALREIDTAFCEMKRMFVYPRFQGQGIGRALAEEVLRQAKLSGYACMRLDTGRKQVEAQGLYSSLGFKEIRPYYELPPELQNWLVFMERKL